MPRLENWTIIRVHNGIVLHGEIHDDEKGRFKDGKNIRTSLVVGLNEEENYAQTKNTKYILGNKLPIQCDVGNELE
jgi:hypothetical protein